MAREGQPFGFDPRHKSEPIPLSDRELIDQARTNPDAFGQLYDRYLSKIYTYHRYRLSSPEEAEDATQETFMSALSHISEFQFVRGDASFSIWLIRIAHNQDVNSYRARASRFNLYLPSSTFKILSSIFYHLSSNYRS